MNASWARRGPIRAAWSGWWFSSSFSASNLVFGLTRSAALVDTDLRLHFYGISLPWLTVVLVAHGGRPVFHLPGRAAQDGLGADPSSLEATVDRRSGDRWRSLLVGTIWRRDEYALLEVVTLYLLVVTAIVLILMVTPNRAEYDKGLWRRARRG